MEPQRAGMMPKIKGKEEVGVLDCLMLRKCASSSFQLV